MGKRTAGRVRGQGVKLSEALGADGGNSTQCVRIYVPNKDSKGGEFGNQRQFVLEALTMLSEINGGASAIPPLEGVWRNDDGELIWESPVLVYSYIRPVEFFSSLPRIREFLHRMGRETKQGEIAFELDDIFFRINHFDSPGADA